MSERAELGDSTKTTVSAVVSSPCPRDAVTVDETLEAAGGKRRIELVGKVQVIAAIGNKDAELSSVGRPGRFL